MAVVTYTVRFIRALKKTYAKKWTFLALFLVILFISFSILLALDWVPDPSKAAADTTPSVTVSTIAMGSVVVAPENPVSISIPTIGLKATIANPDSTNIDVLDAALLHGAVRYPTSAKLGEPGNVILFGHSSYLPIVNNQAYKTFDGIQKLHAGDLIMVSSSNNTYEYSVDTVSKENADSAAIPLTVDGSKLTLSTCDSFATKSDRFVVTATLVASHPNAS